MSNQVAIKLLLEKQDECQAEIDMLDIHIARTKQMLLSYLSRKNVWVEEQNAITKGIDDLVASNKKSFSHNELLVLVCGESAGISDKQMHDFFSDPASWLI